MWFRDTAIYFYYQPSSVAIEIGNEAFNYLLPPKAAPFELIGPQPIHNIDSAQVIDCGAVLRAPAFPASLDHV